MKRPLIIPIAALLAALTGCGEDAGIRLGAATVPDDQTLVRRSALRSGEGRVEATLPGGSVSSTVAFEEQRELRFIPDGTGGDRLRIEVLRDDRSTFLGAAGQPRGTSEPSPMSGRWIAANRDAAGIWKLGLGFGEANPAQADIIAAIQTYENRGWFPGRALREGDRWEFTPISLLRVLQRDVEHAESTGSMTLREVRDVNGRPVAFIDVEMTATGSGRTADGTLSSITFRLRGEMEVETDTLLERRLKLAGGMISGAATVAGAAQVEIPLEVEILSWYEPGEVAGF